MRRAWLAGIVQKFSRASRLGRFSLAPALLPGKPPVFFRSGKSHCLPRIPASGAPSCSALEPAATIDFLRDPLAFHWAIPCAFSIFARIVSALAMGFGLSERETTRGEI